MKTAPQKPSRNKPKTQSKAETSYDNPRTEDMLAHLHGIICTIEQSSDSFLDAWSTLGLNDRIRFASLLTAIELLREFILLFPPEVGDSHTDVKINDE